MFISVCLKIKNDFHHSLQKEHLQKYTFLRKVNQHIFENFWNDMQLLISHFVNKKYNLPIFKSKIWNLCQTETIHIFLVSTLHYFSLSCCKSSLLDFRGTRKKILLCISYRILSYKMLTKKHRLEMLKFHYVRSAYLVSLSSGTLVTKTRNHVQAIK